MYSLFVSLILQLDIIHTYNENYLSKGSNTIVPKVLGLPFNGKYSTCQHP